MAHHSSFVFREPSATCCVVVDEVEDKERLIELYSKVLHFPYGSPNWDSFADCLTDLEWIDASEIEIHHTHLPFVTDPSQQKIYFDILNDAVEASEEHKSPVVKISFAPSLQAEVDPLLA